MPLPQIRDGRTLSVKLPEDVIRRIKLEAMERDILPAQIVLEALDHYWEGNSEASHPLAVPPPEQKRMGERMLRHLEALIAEGKVTAREIEDAAKAEHGDLKRLWAKKGIVPPSCVGRVAKLLAGKKLPIGPREVR